MYRLKKLILNRQPQGIGLVEVILVVAIAGFMITLAISGISNGGRASFDDGMKQVLNDIRLVQNEAASGKGPGKECNPAAVSSHAGYSSSDQYRFWNGCPGSGEEIFGNGISFSLSSPVESFNYLTKTTDGSTVAAAYYSYYLKRGGSNYKETVGGLRNKQNKLPAAIVLSNIEYNGAAVDRAMIQFAAASGEGISPFYFKQATFGDPAAPREQVGFFSLTPAAIYNKYTNRQTGTVTLTFRGSSNSSYIAKIEIDTNAGSVELKQ